MKYILKSLFALIFVCLSFSSCSERQKIKKTMTEFMKTEIRLPTSMTMVHGEELGRSDLTSLIENKLIIYIDSLSCSSCRIGHLNEMLPLYRLSDSLKTFSVMAIFSPVKRNIPEVELQVQLLNFPYPIYIDNDGEFASNNNIPADKRFHDFLINKNGKVLFIGNPLASDLLMTVFMNTL